MYDVICQPGQGGQKKGKHKSKGEKQQKQKSASKDKGDKPQQKTDHKKDEGGKNRPESATASSKPKADGGTEGSGGAEGQEGQPQKSKAELKAERRAKQVGEWDIGTQNWLLF